MIITKGFGGGTIITKGYAADGTIKISASTDSALQRETVIDSGISTESVSVLITEQTVNISQAIDRVSFDIQALQTEVFSNQAISRKAVA